MTIYYRGAGPGSYWAVNDAREIGFTPRRTVQSDAGDILVRMMEHIGNSTAHSPFVSLSRSLLVAQDYGRTGPAGDATSANPGYVYEIELTSPPPAESVLWDPVRLLLAREFERDIGENVLYSHDGPQQLIGALLLLEDKEWESLERDWRRRFPRGFNPQVLHISRELKSFLWALRDTEILVSGKVPNECVLSRTEYFPEPEEGVENVKDATH